MSSFGIQMSTNGTPPANFNLTHCSRKKFKSALLGIFARVLHAKLGCLTILIV
jgi:hypothetical protein